MTINMGRKEPRILEALRLLLEADAKEAADASASASTCRNHAYVILHSLIKSEAWVPDQTDRLLLDNAYEEMRLLGQLERLTRPTGWAEMPEPRP